uniref:TIL domain-containing protein n=1 Tax=Plectus sambesii TaxID=2011161 RepID=A0A914X8U1_9BILA
MLATIIFLGTSIALCLTQSAAQTYQCGVCAAGTMCDYNTGKCQQFRQTAPPTGVYGNTQGSQYNPQPTQYQPATQAYQQPGSYQPTTRYPLCQTCPPTYIPTCPSNSHYTNCGPACPLRCDQISSGVCNMACVAGCVCNDFYVQVSITNKTCVRRESCPTPPPSYNDCTRTGCSYGQVCRNGQCVPQVASTTQPPVSCPYNPPSSTLPPNCKYEVSTDSNGCRVQKLVCPQPEQCGANSNWAECSGTCYRYCDQSSTIISSCNNACQRGCMCSQGYIFQSNNRSLGCIPESQCVKREDPCGYMQCPYGQTCSNGKCVTTPTQCPLPSLPPLPEGCMFQASVDSNGCRVQKLVCPNDDPCAGKQCGYGLVCRNGQCMPHIDPVGPPSAGPPLAGPPSVGPPSTSPPSCPYVPPTPLPSGCSYETSYDSNGCRVQKMICRTL